MVNRIVVVEERDPDKSGLAATKAK